ncbi:T9SS type A sorting domain-containing protein [Calditrichota bacterium]
MKALIKPSVIYTTILSILMPLSVAICGSISGWLLNEVGNPVEVPIEVGYSYNWEMEYSEVFENGEYHFDDLNEGNYQLWARSPLDDEDGWYYKVYYGDVVDEDWAEWVYLMEGQELSDVDFTMRAGGKISGSAVPAEGEQFEEGELIGLVSYWINPVMLEVAQFLPVTDPNNVVSGILPPGEYLVSFMTQPPDMHVTTYYGDTWNQLEAEVVVVEPGEIAGDIDVTLTIGGAISGIVTTSDDQPIRCGVGAFLPDLGPYTFYIPHKTTGTDEEGNYTIYGLPHVGCYVIYWPEDEGYYAREWYNDVYDPRNATVVPVEVGEITEGIDAVLQPGAKVFGTILDPERNPPETQEFGLNAMTAHGNAEYLHIILDEEGNWESMNRLIPDIYAFEIEAFDSEGWATCFLGGVAHGRQSEWFRMPADSETEINFSLVAAGALSVTVNDPEGNQLTVTDIHLYFDGEQLDINQRAMDETGTQYFFNLLPGEYIVEATTNIDENQAEPVMEKLWPSIYSGNSLLINEATSIEVVAGEQQDVELQFVEGGAVAVSFVDPDGNPYYPSESNVGVFPGLVDMDGNAMLAATSYPANPFDDIDLVHVVVPEGEYYVGGLPVYQSSDIMIDPPSVQRTFFGGTLSTEGAEAVEVTRGEITEIEIAMVEDGYSISGVAQTEDGVSTLGTTLVSFDSDGLLMSGYVNFFANYNDSDFRLNGFANGNYYLLAQQESASYILSTWYPDLAAPGMNVENAVIPEGAEVISIENADVENIELVLQQTIDPLSVPSWKDDETVLSSHILHGVYPNPFNSFAQVVFTLKNMQMVSLKMFDLQGRQVRQIVDGQFSAGMHTVMLEATSLSSGTYLLKLEAGETVATTKLMLLK